MRAGADAYVLHMNDVFTRLFDCGSTSPPYAQREVDRLHAQIPSRQGGTDGP